MVVDDVGVGFVSFCYILKLKLDVIKFDISLIYNIDIEFGCWVMVVVFICFVEEMGSKIVVEGVEIVVEL